MLGLQYCEIDSLSLFNEHNFTTRISWSYGRTWTCSEKLDAIYHLFRVPSLAPLNIKFVLHTFLRFSMLPRIAVRNIQITYEIQASAHIIPRYLVWLVHIAIYWVNTPCSLWLVLYQEFIGKLSPVLPCVLGSKASPSSRAVYGRSPAEIVGSNPIVGMDVCLLCVLWVSATSRSLAQRSPTDCGASCVI